MLAVEEAVERTLAEVRVLGTEKVVLSDALGRVLREDVIAIRDVPLGDNSAMDGYAVLASDVQGASSEKPAVLRVVEDVPAGRVATSRVEPGTAIRIMTGALIPDGADVVVPVELTDAGSGSVVIFNPVPRGGNLRARGEDMKQGEVVLSSGSLLGPAEIGVLASVQKSVVRVGRRPTVAILSTGDEIIEIDGTYEPGKVVNSNSYSLSALVRQGGAEPRMIGVVRDSLDATMDAIRASLESDFILSTGGVSVGAFDFVKDALDGLGAETRFWQVAMKPGKPLVLSKLGETLYFGLPGNPVSCMVSFLIFVGPALRKAMGQSGPLEPPIVKARTTGPLRSRGDRRQYLRGRVLSRGGELVLEPMQTQGSGVSTSMVGANGFAIVEEGITELPADTIVDVFLFGPVLSSRTNDSAGR